MKFRGLVSCLLVGSALGACSGGDEGAAVIAPTFSGTYTVSTSNGAVATIDFAGSQFTWTTGGKRLEGTWQLVDKIVEFKLAKTGDAFKLQLSSLKTAAVNAAKPAAVSARTRPLADNSLLVAPSADEECRGLFMTKECKDKTIAESEGLCDNDKAANEAERTGGKGECSALDKIKGIVDAFGKITKAIGSASPNPSSDGEGNPSDVAPVPTDKPENKSEKETFKIKRDSDKKTAATSDEKPFAKPPELPSSLECIGKKSSLSVGNGVVTLRVAGESAELKAASPLYSDVWDPKTSTSTKEYWGRLYENRKYIVAFYAPSTPYNKKAVWYMNVERYTNTSGDTAEVESIYECK